jgi:DNA-binding NarL/FixJ family response regulator
MPAIQTFVIEDSPLIAEDLIDALQELLPMQVLGVADNEAAALRWLSAHDDEVDLVIIDLFLRAGSGLGVLRALQAGAPSYKRVVLSNYASADVRRRCLALGADRVFDKSAQIDDLLSYCRALQH